MESIVLREIKEEDELIDVPQQKIQGNSEEEKLITQEQSDTENQEEINQPAKQGITMNQQQNKDIQKRVQGELQKII